MYNPPCTRTMGCTSLKLPKRQLRRVTVTFSAGSEIIGRGISKEAKHIRSETAEGIHGHGEAQI